MWRLREFTGDAIPVQHGYHKKLIYLTFKVLYRMGTKNNFNWVYFIQNFNVK